MKIHSVNFIRIKIKTKNLKTLKKYLMTTLSEKGDYERNDIKA